MVWVEFKYNFEVWFILVEYLWVEIWLDLTFGLSVVYV